MPGSYRRPEFLTSKDEPTNRIRCPIHGFIHFSENERQIINHSLFRRLRYIRQLALTEFVYPGACHTRFEHVLGVMEVATRAFDTLLSKRGNLMENLFRKVAGFEDRPLEKARQILRLAALLHDIGHASFSHAAEKVIFKGSDHEQLSIKIVKEEGYLGGLIDRYFWEGCARRVGELIEGGRDLPPQFRILRNLVSSQMDADRTDYLLRDSHHCGVDYGRFDYLRMIECLEAQENEWGELELALKRDGIHTFEALILARYQMNTQVYYHRLRRLYDMYLEKYHEALKDEFQGTPEEILSHNDITMMSKIFSDAQSGVGDKRKWAKRITDRNHHRMIFETGVNLDATGKRIFKNVFESIKNHFSDIEVLSDLAEGYIHKLLIPGDKDDKEWIQLSLVEPNGYTKQFGEESQILRFIPRDFACGRIFADSDREKEALIKEIKEFAVAKWREKGGH